MSIREPVDWMNVKLHEGGTVVVGPTELYIAQIAALTAERNQLKETLDAVAAERETAISDRDRHVVTAQRFMNALEEIRKRSATANEYTPDPVGLLNKISKIADETLQRK